jgi:hypothetical protein
MIAWGLGRSGGAHPIEDYLFVRRRLGAVNLEARAGGIAGRVEPLGDPARQGADVFLGTEVGHLTVGALYEKRHDEQARTGVVAGWTSGRVSRPLGEYSLDYTRAPHSISAQIPLAHGSFGFSPAPAPDETLVGELRAVRLRTWWQAGLTRNSYEHPISGWGETSGPGLRAVVLEGDRYLQYEALVSPHTSFGSDWLRDRQGPAQTAQPVVYRFYRRTTSPEEAPPVVSTQPAPAPGAR